MQQTQTQRFANPIMNWVVKRGILFVLTQMPMVALFIGYFFRWTNYGAATAYTVLPAFILLPCWIAYRRKRSDDPGEPVHHFGKYALWALVPYVVYNIVRIPMHYLLGIVFWDHWYDFGSELTGVPVDQYGSLIPGTILHSLQGYVLALGYYILFPKVTLRSALGYVFIFLSAIYTWTFPTFVLVDYQPPPKWFFVVWWAHFWMAIAAYYMPKIYGPAIKEKLRTPLMRSTMLILLVLIYVSPFAFVFLRTAAWQFPLQHEIDQAAFDQASLEMYDSLTLSSSDANAGPAHYQFSLRFGPRPYKDYINAIKALDAGPVRVSGVVMHNGDEIAFCSSYTDMIETPNTILVPALYFPALTRMEFTNITVDCVGPAGAAQALSVNTPLDVRWTADVTLVGDREEMDRRYEGTQTGIPLRIVPGVAPA